MSFLAFQIATRKIANLKLKRMKKKKKIPNLKQEKERKWRNLIK